MNLRQRLILFCGIAVGVVLFAAILSRAQTTGRPGGVAAANSESSPAGTAMDPERAQIWNSPNMLRARAWMQDYFSKSAKITPEEAKRYTTELEHLTPMQMKLWLLKFDHEEEQRQQQYAIWQQAHSAALARATAANQATQRAYADINRGEAQAAGEEQQQLNEQSQSQQNIEESKQLEAVGPYGPGAYPGYGGIHYHFHLYPYPY